LEQTVDWRAALSQRFGATCRAAPRDAQAQGACGAGRLS